jgi:FkbM family methyltransferase
MAYRNDQSANALPVRSRPPALFRFAKMLQHNNIRGSYRFLNASLRFWKNCNLRYSLSSTVSLTVPIWRKEHCWDLKDVLGYERQLIDAFCVAIGSLTNVTLIDCGADIGLFSALVCARSSRIDRVRAFEPNPDIKEFFQRNITSLPDGRPYNLAVSDFTGYGKLERPIYDSSDHARFLAPAQNGIPVITIDSLNEFGGNVAIKIDVEGGELNVIRGARKTIAQATGCVLTLEVHPTVYMRTGVGPAVSMVFLESIRPFRFMVAETGQWVRATDNIVDPDKIVNLLCITNQN